jgi:tight adherence protein B
VRRLRLAAAFLFLIVATLPAAALGGVQLRGVDTNAYPTIRASVVSTQVSSAAPVVTEDGRPTVALETTNLASGKSVVLAIDRSQSMKGRPLAEAVAAARSFVRAKPQGDRIAVTSFATRPIFLTSFSPDPEDAFSAFSSIRVDPKQGTTLYDDLVLAAHKQSHIPFAGRVIIVVTDGNETKSTSSLQDVIDAARRAQTAVYVIGIESPQFNPVPLQEIAAQTGGRYFGTSTSAGIAAVYASIARELARTWRISYVTAARPGDHLRLEASVVGEGTGAADFSIPLLNGDVSAPPPSKLVPKGAYGPGGPLGIGVAVGVLVLFACAFFLTGLRGSWVRGRIAAHVGDTKANAREKRKERRLALLGGVFKLTERAFGNLKQWRWLGRMLERADLPLRTVEFFWVMVACAVVAGLVAAVAGLTAPFILAFMVIAGLIPLGVVWRKMRKRLRAFEDQLPDLLITIAASLKAGHSFKQGVQAVVDEAHPPASEMFKRVLTESALGRSMDDALAEMAERAGSKNFEFAITAVTIQRQVGGSLASLFDMVADTVRQRHQFARKVRSLTAMGRMTAYTLVGVPFFIAGTLTLINRSYMMPLYTTRVGHFMILLGVTMMAIGSVILKKIVSFRG